jgi:hypothetical protein
MCRKVWPVLPGPNPFSQPSLPYHPDPNSFSYNLFRICSSRKSVRNPFGICSSKTKDLNPFRICSYKKHRGVGGIGLPNPALFSVLPRVLSPIRSLPLGSPRQTRFRASLRKTSPLFSSSYELLLLSIRKIAPFFSYSYALLSQHLFCFDILTKTPGWVTLVAFFPALPFPLSLLACVRHVVSRESPITGHAHWTSLTAMLRFP